MRVGNSAFCFRWVQGVETFVFVLKCMANIRRRMYIVQWSIVPTFIFDKMASRGGCLIAWLYIHLEMAELAQYTTTTAQSTLCEALIGFVVVIFGPKLFIGFFFVFTIIAHVSRTKKNKLKSSSLQKIVYKLLITIEYPLPKYE